MTDSWAAYKQHRPHSKQKRQLGTWNHVHMSKNGHFNTQNTQIFFQQPSPQEDGFLHENRPPFHPETIPSIPSIPSFQTCH